MKKLMASTGNLQRRCRNLFGILGVLRWIITIGRDLADGWAAAQDMEWMGEEKFQILLIRSK